MGLNTEVPRDAAGKALLRRQLLAEASLLDVCVEPAS